MRISRPRSERSVSAGKVLTILRRKMPDTYTHNVSPLAELVNPYGDRIARSGQGCAAPQTLRHPQQTGLCAVGAPLLFKGGVGADGGQNCYAWSRTHHGRCGMLGTPAAGICPVF